MCCSISSASCVHFSLAATRCASFRFTVVPDVLGPQLLQELRDYFDEVEARLTGGEEVEYCFRSEHGDVQINHLPLHRPSFRQLLAPPRAFPLVRKAMHAKYGEEPTFLDMADGFVCHDDHGQTWHQVCCSASMPGRDSSTKFHVPFPLT